MAQHSTVFELTSCVPSLPTFVSPPASTRSQEYVGIITDRSAPQQLIVPDGGNGGSAEGSHAAEQQRSAQAAATTHRVHCGETAHQLDVHLPLRLPSSQSSQ